MPSAAKLASYRDDELDDPLPRSSKVWTGDQMPTEHPFDQPAFQEGLEAAGYLQRMNVSEERITVRYQRALEQAGFAYHHQEFLAQAGIVGVHRSTVQFFNETPVSDPFVHVLVDELPGPKARLITPSGLDTSAWTPILSTHEAPGTVHFTVSYDGYWPITVVFDTNHDEPKQTKWTSPAFTSEKEDWMAGIRRKQYNKHAGGLAKHSDYYGGGFTRAARHKSYGSKPALGHASTDDSAESTDSDATPSETDSSDDGLPPPGRYGSSAARRARSDDGGYGASATRRKSFGGYDDDTADRGFDMAGIRKSLHGFGDRVRSTLSGDHAGHSGAPKRSGTGYGSDTWGTSAAAGAGGKSYGSASRRNTGTYGTTGGSASRRGTGAFGDAFGAAGLGGSKFGLDGLDKAFGGAADGFGSRSASRAGTRKYSTNSAGGLGAARSASRASMR